MTANAAYVNMNYWPSNLRQHLSNIPGKHEFKELQKQEP